MMDTNRIVINLGRDCQVCGATMGTAIREPVLLKRGALVSIDKGAPVIRSSVDLPAIGPLAADALLFACADCAMPEETDGRRFLLPEGHEAWASAVRRGVLVGGES